jgi:hypothetical protein
MAGLIQPYANWCTFANRPTILPRGARIDAIRPTN